MHYLFKFISELSRAMIEPSLRMDMGLCARNYKKKLKSVSYLLNSSLVPLLQIIKRGNHE
jgi:hypothetical protein